MGEGEWCCLQLLICINMTLTDSNMYGHVYNSHGNAVVRAEVVLLCVSHHRRLCTHMQTWHWERFSWRWLQEVDSRRSCWRIVSRALRYSDIPRRRCPERCECLGWIFWVPGAPDCSRCCHCEGFCGWHPSDPRWLTETHDWSPSDDSETISARTLRHLMRDKSLNSITTFIHHNMLYNSDFDQYCIFINIYSQTKYYIYIHTYTVWGINMTIALNKDSRCESSTANNISKNKYFL